MAPWKQSDPVKIQLVDKDRRPVCSHCCSHVRCRGEASTSCLDNRSVKLNRAKEKVCQTCHLDILQAALLQHASAVAD